MSLKTTTSDFIIRINPLLLARAHSGNDVAVLVAMMTFCNNGLGECWASYVKIGKVAKVSDKTVTNSIDSTGIFECIGKKPTRGGSVRVYKVRSEFELYIPKPTKLRSSSEVGNGSSEFEKLIVSSKLGVAGYKTKETNKEELNEIPRLDFKALSKGKAEPGGTR